MKKLYTTLAIAIFGYYSYAQTNTFPTTGNAGIGTTGPGSHLEIYELSDSKPNNIAAPTASILKLSRTGTPNYSYYESAEFRIGHGGPSAWGSQLDLFLNGASNQSNVPDQQVMTWLYNGNVGIGTISPALKTEIDDIGTTQTSLLRLNVTGTPTVGSGGAIEFGSSVNTTSSFAVSKIGSYLRTGGTGTEGGDMTFSTRNAGVMTESMRLTLEGNVAIGTTDPKGYKLAVNGNAIATSMTVKLYSAWPDYVFKPTYKLPSLTEVKSYIDQNQHLPEMPSAQEVEKNGVNLGEMVKLQTKKIEELTLYLIEQDKRIKELEKQHK
jgi:hypothetical protein